MPEVSSSGDREDNGSDGRNRYGEFGRRRCTCRESELYLRHPEFEVTVPFKQELHQASDSAILSLLPLPHFH